MSLEEILKDNIEEFPVSKEVKVIAGKKLTVKHVPGPLGVRGRNSDNTMIYKKLGWKPSKPLFRGLEKTYIWIEEQVKKYKQNSWGEKCKGRQYIQ